MNKAVFLDRDGVINRKAPEGDYVITWEEMHIFPGVAEAIALLNRAEYRVIVVSNQRCVAKGLISVADLEMLHRRLAEHLSASGATLDAIYYCPHENDPPCDCRKPQPGMLLAAARDHQIDLSVSWMIGDSMADIEAGRKVGCRTVLVASGDGFPASKPDLVAASLLEGVQQVLVCQELAAGRQDNR